MFRDDDDADDTYNDEDDDDEDDDETIWNHMRPSRYQDAYEKLRQAMGLKCVNMLPLKKAKLLAMPRQRNGFHGISFHRGIGKCVGSAVKLGRTLAAQNPKTRPKTPRQKREREREKERERKRERKR